MGLVADMLSRTYYESQGNAFTPFENHTSLWIP